MMINVSPIDKVSFVNLIPVLYVHSESANTQLQNSENIKELCCWLLCLIGNQNIGKKSHDKIFIMHNYCWYILTHKTNLIRSYWVVTCYWVFLQVSSYCDISHWCPTVSTFWTFLGVTQMNIMTFVPKVTSATLCPIRMEK